MSCYVRNVMPSWKGWGESEVRSKKPPDNALQTGQDHQLSNMVGFTAINSASPPSNACDGLLSNAPARAGRDQPATLQAPAVVSQYLGRGAEDVPAPSKSASKKSSTSKKRAATAPGQSAAKKRKTSDVSDNMPTAKPRAVKKKSSPAKSKTDKSSVDEVALQQSQPSKSTKKSTKNSQQARLPPAQEIESTSTSMPLSVIAPSTSMSILQSNSVPTSYDAAKSSSHGATLYSSSSSPIKSTGLQVSQPLLSKTPKASSKAAAESPNVSRPRKSAAEKPDHDSLFDDTDDFTAALSLAAETHDARAEKEQTTYNAETRRVTRSSKKKTQPQTTPVAQLSNIAEKEDDFFGDDDGSLADAMAVADAVENASVLKKATRTQQTGQTAKRENQPNAKSTFAVPHRIAEPANESGDGTTPMMIASDDEDEDMIEWEKALAAAEKAGVKPRLRSMNMRKVDKHEDYGGALLSEAEKQLLGKCSCRQRFSPSSEPLS